MGKVQETRKIFKNKKKKHHCFKILLSSIPEQSWIYFMYKKTTRNIVLRETGNNKQSLKISLIFLVLLVAPRTNYFAGKLGSLYLKLSNSTVKNVRNCRNLFGIFSVCAPPPPPVCYASPSYRARAIT